MELSDLQSDVDIMAEQEKLSSTSKKGHPSLWAVLQREVLALAQQAAPLQTRFDALENARRIGSSPADQQLDDLRRSINLMSMTGLPLGSSDDATSRTTSHNPCTAEVASIDQSHSKLSQSQVVQLERRIHRLESFLGSMSNQHSVSSAYSLQRTSSSSHGGSPFPILDSIARLEDKLSLLDLKEIDALRTALDGLKIDLETALRPKESRLVETFRGLAGLVQLVDKVDAAADDLPVLVTRLKTLEHLHVAASTFNTRYLLVPSMLLHDVIRDLMDSIACADRWMDGSLHLHFDVIWRDLP